MADETDCIFCEIVAGRSPAHVIAEDVETVSFLDINPVNPGHVLTIPRRHAARMWELSAEEFGSLAAAAHQAADLVRRSLEPPGYDVFVADGEVGGQTAFHVHIHTIPRWPNDAWSDPWVPTAGDPAELAAIAERVRATAEA
ncbi:MAG TPA: HIT domain-containing protein [Candidatus Limnocylindria bacterium]|jgi:histidine triad (HIT) family protein